MTLKASYTFEAIGTQWAIETARPLSEGQKAGIAKIVDSFDQAYSRFRSDSLVMRLQTEGTATFPESFADIYPIYDALYRATKGKVNPLVGGSLERLGYDSGYSLVAGQPAPAPEFSKLALRGLAATLEQPAVLDIGAVGKGYLIDEIAAYLAEFTDEYVVDGSGDIAVSTNTPQAIGLEHPYDSAKIIGTVRMTHQSICGSATNRRAWGNKLHHIIDASTGEPYGGDIVASWAIAANTAVADALATGLFFAEPAALRPYFGSFHYVIMRQNGEVTHNLPARLGELFV